MKRFLKVIFWVAVAIFLLPVVGGFLYMIAKSTVLASSNRIGVVFIKGTITDSFEYTDAIASFRRDDRVKAIIVRIDSPGGGVSAAQELYRELLRTRETKPVVASLGSIATSGGYYVACGANKIIASPGTITGSIGVIAFFPNLAQIFEKIGFETVVIKSGKFKDIGNPGRPMTPEEENLVRDSLMQVHRQFVRDIAVARRLDESKVDAIADGRILTGESALKLGLIDELGNFQDAVQAARLLAHIEGEPELIYHEKKRRLMELLFGEGALRWLDRLSATEVSPVRLQYP